MPVDTSVVTAPETADVVPTRGRKQPVPWRIIFGAIFAVVVSGIGLLLLYELSRIITWILISLFLSVAMSPLVDWFQRRLRFPRGVAVLTSILLLLVLLLAMAFAFTKPLVDQGQRFADNFPQYLTDARNGQGPVGELV